MVQVNVEHIKKQYVYEIQSLLCYKQRKLTTVLLMLHIQDKYIEYLVSSLSLLFLKKLNKSII